MVRNLQELKRSQDELREMLVQKYLDKKISIVEMSKITGVPYTTLRSFLNGKTVNFINMTRLMDWLKDNA